MTAYEGSVRAAERSIANVVKTTRHQAEMFRRKLERATRTPGIIKAGPLMVLDGAPPRRPLRLKPRARSKYWPHQGERERARRVRQGA